MYIIVYHCMFCTITDHDILIYHDNFIVITWYAIVIIIKLGNTMICHMGPYITVVLDYTRNSANYFFVIHSI